MRAQLSVLSSAVILAVVLAAAPDLALARGCGGGGGQNAQPQDDGNHHGGRRNRGGRGGDNSGPNNGHHGGPNGNHHNNPRGRRGGPNHHGPNDGGPHGRWRPRGGGGPDVTVGGYGYPGGRVGPQSPACARLAQMRYELGQLWTLRARIDAGKTVIMRTQGGRTHVVNTRDYTRGSQNWAMSNDGGNDFSAEGHARQMNELAQLRQSSLANIDERISATQDYVGQLEYDCPE
jgi:hypothetical protein